MASDCVLRPRNRLQHIPMNAQLRELYFCDHLRVARQNIVDRTMGAYDLNTTEVVRTWYMESCRCLCLFRPRYFGGEDHLYTHRACAAMTKCALETFYEETMYHHLSVLNNLKVEIRKNS